PPRRDRRGAGGPAAPRRRRRGGSPDSARRPGAARGRVPERACRDPRSVRARAEHGEARRVQRHPLRLPHLAVSTSVLPPVVDAAWVAEHLGEEDLLLADVRGPNAHTRGHLPGSIPLVLGSPAPVTDPTVLRDLPTH